MGKEFGRTGGKVPGNMGRWKSLMRSGHGCLRNLLGERDVRWMDNGWDGRSEQSTSRSAVWVYTCAGNGETPVV